jgi:sulfatase modifying factor 1
MTLIIICCVLALNACKEDGGTNQSLITLFGGGLSAGDMKTYTADSVSFNMAYVPGGKTFPTGVNDDGSATVVNAYWIGETEVTYDLWQKVYDWATTDAGGGLRSDGGVLYTFSHAGTQGDGAGDTNQHPVTTINWRDSMVWCNALTEWYNAYNGTSYGCVYFTDSGYATPLRTSTDSITITWDVGGTYSGTEDEPFVNPGANGFRFLSKNEWELAARYIDGTTWLYGDHASGDQSGACYNDGSILGGQSVSTVFGDYAVYSVNAGSSTAIVKSKAYNALGLYDMSGNVFEWCFDWNPGDEGALRVMRGGSWFYDDYALRAGVVYNGSPYYESDFVGLRIGKNQ